MSILSSLGGLGINMAASAFNNKMADKAADKQYQRQLDFWEKQNQYNDPSAQRSRLERAGYNPATAAGQVAQNNSASQLSSVPGNEYAQRGAVDPNALNNSIMAFGKLEQIGANTDLMQRQLELSYLTELVQKSELYGINLTNQEKEKMLSWLDKEKELSLEKMFEEIRTMRSQQDVNATQAEANTASAAASNAQAGLLAEQALTESELRELRKDSLIAGNDWTRTQQNIAEAMQPYEQAYKSAQTAEAKESALLRRQEALKVVVDKVNAVKANDRAAALHTVQLETAKYARDLGASEAQLAQINEKVSKLWYDDDRPDIVNTILDFIHNNLRLAGSASYSRK